MIRILALSDQVVNTFYQATLADLVGRVDVLLGCGDLPYTYMEHIVTTLNLRDAFFVPGNHDAEEWLSAGGSLQSPGGWQNVDGRAALATGKALIVAGLGGSPRYQRHAGNQYSEFEMAMRAWQLVPRFLFNRMRYGRYVDVFITHAPPRDIHDGPDRAHRGFAVFRRVIQQFRPRLFLHGHMHQYGPGTWHTRYEDTEVVNVHPFRVIELEAERISYGRLHRH
ncbi:MAG TPA: metallophosphoesterase [Anaerolineae bacterium]|nr:metallophosphoesterase [Anaerolineae bacterium]HQI83461.1 metallophosphoesterase [Anaerolineae bacterium]